jgi:hypothetical protein
MDDPVCIICGAKFEEGKGFVEPHVHPCTNARYGWNFCLDRNEYEKLNRKEAQS